MKIYDPQWPSSRCEAEQTNSNRKVCFVSDCGCTAILILLVGKGEKKTDNIDLE